MYVNGCTIDRVSIETRSREKYPEGHKREGAPRKYDDKGELLDDGWISKVTGPKGEKLGSYKFLSPAMRAAYAVKRQSEAIAESKPVAPASPPVNDPTN